MDLSLFVLEGDVQAHDVTVLHAAGQVAVSATVIENETLDELGLGRHLVLHVHQLNHVQVDWLVLLGNAVDSINDDLAHGVGELRLDLGAEGSAGNLEEHVTVDFDFVLEGVEVFEGLSLGQLHTVDEDTGVDSFTEVALSLTHELTNEEDVSGGTVTDDVVLSGSSTADHGSSRVLNLHLVEKNSAILGQLDLASATNEPKSRINSKECSRVLGAAFSYSNALDN